MPRRQFALEPNGPKRLEMVWGFMFKNFRIRFDGQDIGGFPDGAALRAGNRFALPDGSELHVVFEQGFGRAELKVLRNGVPLPGSDADPAQQVGLAAGVVYFLGGLNVLLGLVAELGNVGVLREIGLGWGSAAVGALYGVLGFFVGRRSRIALGVAMAMFTLDGLYSVYVTVGSGANAPIGAIAFRAFLLMAMARGFKAMGQPTPQAAAPQLYR